MIPFVWEEMEVRLTPGFLKSLTLSHPRPRPLPLLGTATLGPGFSSLEVHSVQRLIQTQASESRRGLTGSRGLILTRYGRRDVWK